MMVMVMMLMTTMAMTMMMNNIMLTNGDGDGDDDDDVEGGRGDSWFLTSGAWSPWKRSGGEEDQSVAARR